MRQPRDVRRRGREARLSPRDEALLRALARFRIARTSDLADLVFGGTRRDTAARRLRSLYDARYLDVIAGDRAAENVYTLGDRGREWARSHDVAVGRRPRETAHHLAVVRVWVSLALAVHECPDLRLHLVRPDWELRGHALTVVPDAMVELRVSWGRQVDQLFRICVEVDRGTEPLATIREKLRGYVLSSLRPDGLLGWEGFGLLLVLDGRGVARAAQVAAALEEVWSGRAAVCCGTQPDELAAALERLIAPSLTGSPCSKGMVAGVRHGVGGSSVRPEGGL